MDTRENLRDLQLNRIFLILWNQILITVFTAARHLSLLWSDRCPQTPLVLFLNIHFNVFFLFAAYAWVLHVVYFRFPHQDLYAFLFCLVLVTWPVI